MFNLKKWISKTKAASKSMLSIVLVLCLLAVMLPVGLVFATDVSAWNGSAIDENLDGSGTQGDPYQITSAAELAFVAQKVNAKEGTYNAAHYKLMCDIDLNSQKWTTIGQESTNPFKGTFDGDDHTITGYVHNESANGGIFGYISDGAAISNLHIRGASVTLTNKNFGGITCQAKDATITNCSFDGTITMSTTTNKIVGGLVGNIAGPNVALANCWSSGAVTRPSTCIAQLGGIFGQMANNASATLTNCYSTMTLLTNSTNLFDHATAGTSHCGGLFGNGGTGSLTLINCYFAGKLTKNRPYPIGQTQATTSTYSNVFYRADWYTTAVEAAGAGIADASGNNCAVVAPANLAKQLNDKVDTLKAAGTQGLSYWAIAEDGTPTFILMPKLTSLSIDVRTIPFNSATTHYDVIVSNDVRSAKVTATAEGGASVTINDESVNALDIPLTANDTTTITVVVERDGLSNIYTIDVICTAAWDGITIATEFSAGTGTKDDPYQIKNGAELAFLADRVNDRDATYNAAHYKLIGDIDLNDQPWTPIGKAFSTGFQGTFDGCGYAISGLLFANNTSTAENGGLFGYVYGATIRNVHIKDASLTAQAGYIGGIAGQIGDNSTVTNCSFDGALTTSGDNNKNGGGIVANVAGKNVTFTNCWSTGTASIYKSRFGGIIGQLADDKSATLTNCYSTMEISTTYTGLWGEVGGLFGKGGSASLTLNNCYFAGSLPEKFPNPVGQSPATTAKYSNVYYKAGCVPVGTPVAGAGIDDANASDEGAIEAPNDLAKQLNDNVRTLKVAGTQGLSYWIIAEDGTPTFAVMPKLTALSINCGTILFNPATTRYDVEVSNVVTSATVMATAEGGASVTINDESVNALDIPLTANGTTKITVVVEHEYDGVTVDEIYTINITRTNSGSTTPDPTPTPDPAPTPDPTPTPGPEPEREPNLTPEPFANYSEETAGTAENPYKIANAAQLYFLAKTAKAADKEDVNKKVAITVGGIEYMYSNYKGKHFILTADIDWKNDVWVPIGGSTYDTAFSGRFDGNGHKVRNINCTTSQSGAIGFFGSVAESTIKNLAVVSATIKHDRDAGTIGIGGIVGTCHGRNSFINVHFDGNIEVTKAAHWNTYVGGIFGYSRAAVIKLSGCSTTGSIKTERPTVGGLVGNCFASSAIPGMVEISGSYSAMDIVCTTTSFSGGGLVGKVSDIAGANAVNVINCHFAGTINKPFPVSSAVTTVTVEDDVYYVEGCYTGTDGAAMSGAGVDAANPNARERSKEAFKDGTVKNLLNLTSIGATSWKDGTDYPINVTVSGKPLITGVALSGAAFTFDPNIFTYDLSVPYSTSSAVVMVEAVDNAIARVNGVLVPKGSLSQPFTLTVGVPQKIYLQLELNGVINTYLFKVTRREQAPDGIWDGSYEPFDTSNKKGTDLDNPILIENAAQLAFLAAMTNGKTILIGDTVYTPPEASETSPLRYYVGTYFKLAADIKLNDLANYENWDKTAPLNVWEPIGFYAENNVNTSRVFDGTIDGNGHTISGLYVSMGSDKRAYGAGLFGSVGAATIRNLHVKQSYVSGDRGVGGIVGAVKGGSTAGQLTMQNCSYSGTVKTSTDRAGGLVGLMFPGTEINSCWSEGKVIGGSFVGGLVGWAQLQRSLDIVNSYSVMTVECTKDVKESVGGLVGGCIQMGGTLYVRRSYFAGSVETNTPIVGSVEAGLGCTMDSVYYREGCHQGTANEEFLYDAVEYSVEEFKDGTVTQLLNKVAEYGDFWNWKDGENGYPVSDGVILVTDFRTYTDDSNYGNSTAWADKFVIADGGILKKPNSNSGNGDLGNDLDNDFDNGLDNDFNSGLDNGFGSDSGDDLDNNPITGESSVCITVVALFLVSAVFVLLLARRKYSAD